MTVAPGVHLLGRTFPNASYAVETSDGLVLVDTCPEPDADPILRQLREAGLDVKRLRAILLTHAHGDHALGARRLREMTGAKVHAGVADCDVLRAGGPKQPSDAAIQPRTPTMTWNIGDIFSAIAPGLGDEPALIHHGGGEGRPDRTISWKDLDRRSNALARKLVERGAKPDDKVAIYAYNRPEWLEAVVANGHSNTTTTVKVEGRYRDADFTGDWAIIPTDTLAASPTTAAEQAVSTPANATTTACLVIPEGRANGFTDLRVSAKANAAGSTTDTVKVRIGVGG